MTELAVLPQWILVVLWLQRHPEYKLKHLILSAVYRYFFCYQDSKAHKSLLLFTCTRGQGMIYPLWTGLSIRRLQILLFDSSHLQTAIYLFWSSGPQGVGNSRARCFCASDTISIWGALLPFELSVLLCWPKEEKNLWCSKYFQLLNRNCQVNALDTQINYF